MEEINKYAASSQSNRENLTQWKHELVCIKYTLYSMTSVHHVDWLIIIGLQYLYQTINPSLVICSGNCFSLVQ